MWWTATYQFINYEDCFVTHCSGTGRHTDPNDPNCTASDKGGMRCVTRWITVTHTDDPCDTGGGSGNSNPPSGGDNGVTGVSPGNEDEESIIAINPNAGDEVGLTNDPNCNSIAVLNASQDFKDKIEDLEGNLGLRRETGYQINLDANGDYEYVYKENTTTASSEIGIGITPTTVGALHVHYNKRDTVMINSSTGRQGNFSVGPTYMFSPRDVDWLIDAVRSRVSTNNTDVQNHLNAQQVFAGMVSDGGNYIIKFEGPLSQLPNIPVNFDFHEKAFVARYNREINKDRQAGLLRFLKTEFQIFDVGLYQIKIMETLLNIHLMKMIKKLKKNVMMKISQLIIMLLFVCSYGQQAISLEQRAYYFDNDLDLPSDVTEINDVNHVLDDFLGTWIGAYNGNTIEINVTYERFSYAYSNTLEDMINFTYAIKDSNGNELVSSSDPELGRAYGLSYQMDGSYRLELPDACSQDRSIVILPFHDPNSITNSNMVKTKMEFAILSSNFSGMTSNESPNLNCTSVASYLPYFKILIFDKQ
ncbi:hypothetical protein JCM19296_248 [Nonlabens ulvanivorans]|uniref:Uncharacterized protein n=1 Tax=Nonlabens ulvanivorans TaxID=906888 RepID=A0A081D6X4_NONUL|nr:hypothetical protein [Nonlabens ulvanivorans]GAK74670.1 hypothetical protein JCM19296_248 [Nonlabens ulvanivorans]